MRSGGSRASASADESAKPPAKGPLGPSAPSGETKGVLKNLSADAGKVEPKQTPSEDNNATVKKELIADANKGEIKQPPAQANKGEAKIPPTKDMVTVKKEPPAEGNKGATNQPAAEDNEGGTKEPVAENKGATKEPAAEANKGASEEPIAEANEDAQRELVVEGNKGATEERAAEANKSASEQPAAEANKGVTKEPAAEANKCVTKEPAAEDNKCVTKEPAAEDNKCVTKEPAAEDNKCVTKEPAAEANKGVTKEPAAEDNKCVTKEPAAEDNKGVTKEPAVEDNKCVTKESSTEANKGAAMEPAAQAKNGKAEGEKGTDPKNPFFGPTAAVAYALPPPKKTLKRSPEDEDTPIPPPPKKKKKMLRKDRTFNQPPEVMKKPLGGIRVGIIAASYPETLLSAEQLKLLRFTVLEQLVPEKQGAFKPKFLGTSAKPGFIIFHCEDKATVLWLKRILKKLKAVVETDLRVLDRYQIPRKLTVVGYFRNECRARFNKIFETIKKHNEGLNVDAWVLHKLVTKAIFAIDHQSAAKLIEDKFKINFNERVLELKPDVKFQKNIEVTVQIPKDRRQGTSRPVNKRRNPKVPRPPKFEDAMGPDGPGARTPLLAVCPPASPQGTMPSHPGPHNMLPVPEPHFGPQMMEPRPQMKRDGASRPPSGPELESGFTRGNHPNFIPAHKEEMRLETEANKDAVKESTTDANNGAVKEPAAEGNISASKQSAGEANKGAMKEPSAEANKSASKQPAGEANKCVTKESATETSTGATKQSTTEVNKGATKEPAAKANKGAIKGPAEEDHKGATKQPGAEGNKDATKQPAPETNKDATKEPDTETKKGATNQPVTKGNKDATKELAAEANKSTLKQSAAKDNKGLRKEPAAEDNKGVTKEPAAEDTKCVTKEPAAEDNKCVTKESSTEANKGAALEPAAEAKRDKEEGGEGTGPKNPFLEPTEAVAYYMDEIGERKRFCGPARKRFKWLLSKGFTAKEARGLVRKCMQQLQPIRAFKHNFADDDDDDYVLPQKMLKRSPEDLEGNEDPSIPLTPPPPKKKMLSNDPTFNQPPDVMKEPLGGILVGIIAAGYPETLLSAEQLKLLRFTVLEQLVPEKQGAFKPKFLGTSAKPGFIVFHCEDKATVLWLQRILHKLNAVVEADLRALAQCQIPRKLAVVGCFPNKRRESVNKIFETIKEHNRGLNVDAWVLQKVVTQAIIHVDHQSAAKLVKDKFKVNFKKRILELKPDDKFQYNVEVTVHIPKNPPKITSRPGKKRYYPQLPRPTFEFVMGPYGPVPVDVRPKGKKPTRRPGAPSWNAGPMGPKQGPPHQNQMFCNGAQYQNPMCRTGPPSQNPMCSNGPPNRSFSGDRLSKRGPSVGANGACGPSRENFPNRGS